MNPWTALCLEVHRLRLDVDVAEAEALELDRRANTVDGRAEGAWERLMSMIGRP